MMTQKSNTVFRETVKKIENAYSRLGYNLGWRFLYSPSRTLDPETKTIFLGVNPGGHFYVDPVPSVERGNAYRVENWPDRGATHQREVCLLFKGLAAVLNRLDEWQTIIDDTLTTNICPFRSSSWGDLPRKKEAMAFSYELWSHIISYLKPRLVICNGRQTHTYFSEVLRQNGFTTKKSEQIRTGWGETTYTIETMNDSSREIVVTGLPHLSRFRTISRSRCVDGTKALLRALGSFL